MTMFGASKNGFLTMAVVGATLAAVVALRPAAADRGPSIAEIKRIAEVNGFLTYPCANPNFAGGEVVCREFVISNKPLSADDVAELNMSSFQHPSWRGRICVMLPNNPYQKRVFPIPDDIVGDLHFFGDKEIIKAIKACIASSRKNG